MKKGSTLMDVLARCHGKTVLIGVRSSFFFIGPCEEAISDIDLLGIMARCCVALVAHNDISRFLNPCDIGQRKVLKTYVRNPDYAADEIVIVIEGREFGSFWTREEYLSGKCALESLMAADGHGDVKAT